MLDFLIGIAALVIALMVLKRFTKAAPLRNVIVALLVVFAAWFFYEFVFFDFVPYYGRYTVTYECSGVMTKAPSTSGPITLFVKITQNRWWSWPKMIDGDLRLESTTGSIRMIPGDAHAVGFFSDGTRGYQPALFPGLFKPDGSEREDLFAIKRVDTFLNLYRWPKAGKAVDLTKTGEGQFSTVSNFLTLNISDEESFRATCSPKNN
jgi:hypothetical protein